ncbi:MULTISPECIES: hypothetical protein [Staphylococcus]|uniref:hypothetical protein n=1 Tax=Staphylococcus TaxID=1279 RepID=UPI0007640CEF|nr:MULTISPECIES: hypothetical protein [Staphylococcus]KXA44550.1 hypothetical protein HMPREF3215_01625 [Staphylococcus simulans]OFM14803.1 hypothetical protein HMPREF2713_09270 [Staphylococcus sp. HMSC059E03]OFN19819.1 hypothetical protein HMPREF2603_08470 [Staphylococcus sp. HMSC055C03]OFV07315.1 hypothetical protein HMPREF3124_03645 [Staphylococcus sp. HMSC12H08]OHR53078.1 hypothetical protein HMPREF2798_08425 [Staphylococcus sp. HMSC070A03]
MDLKKYSHKFIDVLDESEVQGTIEYSNYDKKQTLVFTYRKNLDVQHVIVGSDNSDEYQKQCVANIEKILSDRKKVNSNA